MEIERFKGQKIAILGFGVEGRSAYNFLKKAGASLTVFDEFDSPEHPANTTVSKAEDWDLTEFDLVVRAPGIALHRIQEGAKLTSLSQLFFELCPAKIIGVTGTKGKGTTSSLIAKILEAAGKKVHLLGNIGAPALGELDQIEVDDWVVYEMSSFQLWDMTISPHIAVVLMVEPEHLDVHVDVDDYLAAKSNISKHQSSEDITIYHPFNEMSEEIAVNGEGIKKKYMAAGTARIDFGNLVIGTHEIMPTEEFGLVGPHNRENICAAVTAAWEITQDVNAIRAAVSEFRGLEHRLEFVDEVNGVSYYNDSFATVPGATIAALHSFEAPERLILGGSDKNSDYTDLAEAISLSDNIKQIYLIGEMADRIKVALNKFDYHNVKKLSGNIDEIVKTIANESEEGDVVILSPACASFDMFDNYKQRGQLFKEAVGKL